MCGFFMYCLLFPSFLLLVFSTGSHASVATEMVPTLVWNLWCLGNRKEWSWLEGGMPLEEHSPQKAVHEGRDSVTTFNDISKAGQKEYSSRVLGAHSWAWVQLEKGWSWENRHWTEEDIRLAGKKRRRTLCKGQEGGISYTFRKKRGSLVRLREDQGLSQSGEVWNTVRERQSPSRRDNVWVLKCRWEKTERSRDVQTCGNRTGELGCDCHG